MKRVLSPPYAILADRHGIVLSKEPPTTYNCPKKGDPSRANLHRLPGGKAIVQEPYLLSASVTIRSY